MSRFLIGVYWKNRVSTLKEFASLTKKILSSLQNLNIEFTEFELVGNAPGSVFKITDDLGNLSELIYNHALDNTQIYSSTDINGDPTWEATTELGYNIIIQNGKDPSSGGITLAITAGMFNSDVVNSITLRFPKEKYLTKETRQLFDYSITKDTILAFVTEANPAFGYVMVPNFSECISAEGRTDVGWLTYIKNSNASAMRNNPDLIAAGIEMEPVSIGGTLFSIDREMVSPDNEVQVARAKLLRAKLMENHLIDS